MNDKNSNLIYLAVKNGFNRKGLLDEIKVYEFLINV